VINPQVNPCGQFVAQQAGQAPANSCITVVVNDLAKQINS
jgi:hypothetical protein